MPCLAPLLTILLALPVSSTGGLRLQSQPSVEVLWEGVGLGETDAEGLLVIEEIPPGAYRMTLRKRGFHDLDTQIEVEQGINLSKELLLKSVSVPGIGESEGKADRKSGAEPLMVGIGLLMTMLAGAAGARLLSKRRNPSAVSNVPPHKAVGSISEDYEIPVFEETEHGSPSFLEDLRRRELDSDDTPETPSKRSEETIIEVEAVEVTTDRPSTGG